MSSCPRLTCGLQNIIILSTLFSFFLSIIVPSTFRSVQSAGCILILQASVKSKNVEKSAKSRRDWPESKYFHFLFIPVALTQVQLLSISVECRKLDSVHLLDIRAPQTLHTWKRKCKFQTHRQSKAPQSSPLLQKTKSRQGGGVCSNKKLFGHLSL